MASTPTPTVSHFPTVDMGPGVGLVTLEVVGPQSSTYRGAYEAAVEQLLLEPEATILHSLRARLDGDM